MFVTGKYLSRRTLLRGIGAAVALPFLDSMVPAFAAPSQRPVFPNRLFFTYIPIGAIMDEWYPEGGETGIHFQADSQSASGAPGRSHVAARAGPSHRIFSRRWRRGPCSCRCLLLNRCSSQENIRCGHSCGHFGRSDNRFGNRLEDQIWLVRTWL